MKSRIIKKDISRNKVITSTLFMFILLAAMLVSGAVNIIITLFGSMNSLFERSIVPHYVQMHSGEIDQDEIDRFAENNPLAKDQLTVTMLGINGAYIYLGNNVDSEANSIIENSFITQNDTFDFLLDTESENIQVNDGEVAVPIYHMQEYGLRLGDAVRIVKNDFSMELVITAFVRDAQMNPSIVTSKRFVVNENDWQKLYSNFGQIEYSIEFLLHDASTVNEFGAMYQASSLPQKDTTITYSLFQVMSALTDGIMAAVIVLISLLLIAISALCLRFTLTTTIEEDYREIGVMKAIGISGRDIRSIYMLKYVAMAAVASMLGYIISSFAGNLFTANISLYMGTAPKTIWNRILPALGAFAVFIIVMAFCRLVLRRFRKISAVEALRDGNSAGGRRKVRNFRLSRSKFKNINIFLGIKSVFNRFSVYGVLCLIFIICAFLMIVPLNFHNTLNSPDFVAYMGAGRSDIRIDLQQGEDMEAQYRVINEYLENDADVIKFTSLVTAAYKVKNADGEFENFKIEVVDFSVFPLEYLDGSAPASENEIALSAINADDLKKAVGDTIILLVGNEERTLTVSGTYQDVTNGGKTAKSILPYTSNSILWYVVNIDVVDGVSVSDKIAEYNSVFSPVKITSMDEYVTQTLGGLISQLSLTVVLGFVLAITIAVLITAMFFKMLIAKDASQIAIMRSLGLSYRDIRLQYITRAILVLIISIVIGFIAAVTLGQGLAGMLISGITSMRFIINPIMSFIVCPMALAGAVGITIFFSSSSIQKLNIMMIAE